MPTPKPLKIAKIILLIAVVIGLGWWPAGVVYAHTMSSPEAMTNTFGIFGAFFVSVLGSYWLAIMFFVFIFILGGVFWTVTALRKRLSYFK